ncbi:MAG TPA: 50S ribosomal protein L11 methyltransferase, partial [Caulobacteraceae bacterium]
MAAAVQITARGARAYIEAADAVLGAEPALEAAAWSRIEEDEARAIWRIDAYPSTEDEARAMRAILDAATGLHIAAHTLADADW